MQAFANEITGKLENPSGSEKESINTMDNDNRTPLFPADDVIFQNDTNDRPFARYGYRVSNMNFLVPEKVVSEVIQAPNIFNLPNSPSWIEGLINIRGNIIPVMNLNKLLKQTSTKKETSILVLDKSDNKTAIAILISELPITLEHNNSKTSASNYPSELHEYIKPGFTQNNHDWVEFNPQKLFENLAEKDRA